MSSRLCFNKIAPLIKLRILSGVIRRLSSSSLAELIRPIAIKTCVNLYPRLQHLNPKLYPLKVPTDGVKLTVNYLDTANHNQNFDKVVLAIPGAAGSYLNFEKNIIHLRESDVRVIAPNLPDFSHTRQSGGLFWHTTAEKVAFLKDFLKQINVQKIDCIMGHSMAMHSILGMCDELESLQVKSVILFSPQPLYDLSLDKAQLTQRLLFSFRSEFWFNLLDAIKLHKWSWMHSYKFDTLNNFLLFWMPSLDPQASHHLPRRIYKVRKQSQVNVAIVYGGNEKLVSQASIQMLFKEFGIADTEVEVLSTDSVGIFNAERIKAFTIAKGGHFAHVQFPDLSNAIIDHMLHLENHSLRV